MAFVGDPVPRSELVYVKGHIRANGDEYSGYCRYGEPNDIGVFKYANGDSYSGQFLNGQRHGLGVYQYADGRVYKGQWKTGQAHGLGCETGSSGAYYRGEWKEDESHGYGVEIMENGDSFKGYYEYGMPNGPGTLMMKDEEQYDGYFEDGEYHGNGIWYPPDKLIDENTGNFMRPKEGTFERGEFSQRHRIDTLLARAPAQKADLLAQKSIEIEAAAHEQSALALQEVNLKEHFKVGQTKPTKTTTAPLPESVPAKKRMETLGRQKIFGIGPASKPQDLYLWGSGDGRLFLSNAPEEEDIPIPIFMRSIENMPALRTIAIGSSHAIAITYEIKGPGSLLGWGRAMHGRLGTGSESFVKNPEAIPMINRRRVLQVACGVAHSLVLLDTFAVVAFGANDKGQLGIGEPTGSESKNQLGPVVVKSLESIRRITCGQYSSAAIKYGGELYTWGLGSDGQLGNGRHLNIFKPSIVDEVSHLRAEDVAMGSVHMVIISEGGQVFTCGKGEGGRLGLTHYRNVSTPSRIKRLNGLKSCSVACGVNHSLILTKKGVVFSWGSGPANGCQEEATIYRPRQVPLPHTITKIAAGSKHSVALTDEGKVYTWGEGMYGQLGHGDFEDSNKPRIVDMLESQKIVTIGAGHNHTYALPVNR